MACQLVLPMARGSTVASPVHNAYFLLPPPSSVCLCCGYPLCLSLVLPLVERMFLLCNSQKKNKKKTLKCQKCLRERKRQSDFSRNKAERNNKQGNYINKLQRRSDVCVSFEQAAHLDLIRKLSEAVFAAFEASIKHFSCVTNIS